MKDLLSKHHKVYFYVNDEMKLNFYEELKKLNVTFKNGKSLNVEDISNLMCIDHNFHVTYISYIVWVYSFYISDVLKVDYQKYKSNQDYIIKKCNECGIIMS